MYNYVIVSILGIVCIIILNCYFYYRNNKILESFTKTEAIILVGDSILKNNSYVSEGSSVQELLSKNTETQIYCYAVNDSIIKDAYKQVNILPQHLNMPSTCIFLSIGGNDILKGIDNVTSIFRQYIDLVDLIKERMDKSHLVLINLYYPTNEKYEKYYSSVTRWNELVNAYAKDNHLKVLDISKILKDSSDFTSEIEPSETGGEKLANQIAIISI